jgi:transposase
MLGPPKLRALDQPVIVSLERLVPANHFYRHLDAALDLTFVREWVADCYADRGRPSIDPVVFFKLQLILFFEGLRSERRLIETASLHLAHRWYLGYGLDEPQPDHSSLTRIRQRLGLPIFERFFEHVVDLCQQAGLIWGQELFFDATKIRANAALNSVVPRFYLQAKHQAQEHVATLFAEESAPTPTVGAPQEPAPTTDGRSEPRCCADGPVPQDVTCSSTPIVLPATGSAEEIAQLAAANQAEWRLLEHHRLDPARGPASGYQRLTDLRVSPTDPTAALMNDRGRSALGYHDHYVVDGGKARIILQAFVTPADVMENTPMLDLLRRARFRWKLRPKRAVGDTTYGTGDNLRELEAEGIRAYVPLPDWGKRSPYFGQREFTYDAEQDVYRCPQGTILSARGNNYVTQVRIYQAPTDTCRTCDLRARCTDSAEGRKVTRSFDEEYRERVRQLHATPAYAKAMRKRAVWVEPLFGEAKQWHNLRQFRLRGLENVNIEAQLVAAGQNLKRWLVRRGWGRRHGPAGSLLVQAPRSTGTGTASLCAAPTLY